MREFDAFARQLFEEAKRFLEKAREQWDDQARDAHLHAALIIGFCALEAHINAIADEFVGREELSPHEHGLLGEREVRLIEGEFELTDALRMSRIEERIQFLVRKFSGDPVKKNDAWWDKLKSGLDLRNRLTHPKQAQVVSVAVVERAFEGILGTLDAVYQAVYRKRYPAIGRCLNSTLEF